MLFRSTGPASALCGCLGSALIGTSTRDSRERAGCVQQGCVASAGGRHREGLGQRQSLPRRAGSLPGQPAPGPARLHGGSRSDGYRGLAPHGRTRLWDPAQAFQDQGPKGQAIRLWSEGCVSTYERSAQPSQGSGTVHRGSKIKLAMAQQSGCGLRDVCPCANEVLSHCCLPAGMLRQAARGVTRRSRQSEIL